MVEVVGERVEVNLKDVKGFVAAVGRFVLSVHKNGQKNRLLYVMVLAVFEILHV